MNIKQVNVRQFHAAYREAHRSSYRVSDACTHPDKANYFNARCYLSDDGKSGYCVRSFTGELLYLYSLAPGRGDDLVGHAVSNGARKLDCFDGYLVDLYERHGFTQVRRVKNTCVGGPDVVYMQLILE